MVQTYIYNPRLQGILTQNVVLATCEHIRTHCGGALGFFPASGWVSAMGRDRILCAGVNEDIECVGWIVWTKVRQRIAILAIGVEEDFRRGGIGTKLIQGVIKSHRKDKITEVCCRCRADLEANAFWAGAGFELVDSVDGRNKTGKKINQYRMEVTEGGVV